jgi:UDP-N-acetylmuramoyl-L-alanyl-D-glutamate--2,6-diaminopimelate ligase
VSADRHQSPRRLASLLADDAHVAPEEGNLWIHALSADSRSVRRGALFAALPGVKSDGAAFAAQAAQAGAVAVLAGRSAPVPSLQIPVIRVDDPRRIWARIAARFFARQPRTVVAVTGTNGKTSVSVFLRQIWEHAGHRSASLGTIGLIAPGGAVSGSLTTPDPIELHRTLAELADDQVTHLALEASSHGLDQRRLDGISFAAGAFTNLSRDHLDYHGTLQRYLEAKLRLFGVLLPKGAAAVADCDHPEAEAVRRVAERRGLVFCGVGRAGETLKLVSVTRMPDGVRLLLQAGSEKHYVPLPLLGDFQVSNALVAAALAVATGVELRSALAALAELKGASGRLEHIGTHPTGAAVFVDYAHTPDALTNALRALRPHTEGQLTVVFGAGGDRDAGKRPLMGRAAAGAADKVIVTDDNPRSEDPARIRRAVLAGAPKAREIGGRREAIRAAVAELGKGDVLLIAGKGHETGQTIGDTVYPFSDQDEARQALADAGAHGA